MLSLDPNTPDPATAWDRLVASFRAGKVKTEAQLVKDPGQHFMPIQASSWRSLILMEPIGKLVDALCYADEVPVYFNVVVDKESLLEQFRPRKADLEEPSPTLTMANLADVSPSEGQLKGTSNVILRCRRELEAEIREHPDGPREKRRWTKRDDFVAWAQTQGLGPYQSLECWKAVMRKLLDEGLFHSWSSSGAPKKGS